MKKIILTHYDLDGAVAGICAKTAMPDAILDFVNYTKIEQVIEGIVVENVGSKTVVFVLDFRLGLRYIDRLLQFDEFKLCIIDHHIVDELEMEKMIEMRANSKGRFMFIHDTTKSGALLTYEYFSKVKSMGHLDELVYITDTYDCWREEREDFKTLAIPLNEVFWKMKEFKFVDKFMNGYVVDREVQDCFDEFEQNRAKSMQDTMRHHSTNITFASGRRALFIINPAGVDYINLFTIYYPMYQYFFIYTHRDKDTKQFHVSVRLRECPTTIQEIAAEMAAVIPEVSGGGHTSAGGFVFPETVDIEKFFETVAEIAGKIDEKYK